MWKHWVARALTPFEPFKEFESAQWFWKSLQERFPEMISGVLMPNHLHLILPSELDAHRGLAGLLGALTIRCGLKRPWQPLPEPAFIPDVAHLRRQIRYVALNPCRKRLCADPLEWYWSTYREYLGASVHVMQTTADLQRVLKDSSPNFKVRFHAYVSADPSVSVTGTPFPQPERSRDMPERAIAEILDAAAAALRVRPSEVQKRGPLRSLFIALAYQQGWRKPRLLAEICGMTPGAVHQVLAKGTPIGLEAAQLCLGDRRLVYRNGGSRNLINSTERTYP